MSKDIEVLDLIANEDFNIEDAVLGLDQEREVGYVANMQCPVPECNFQGNFPPREKYQRH